MFFYLLKWYQLQKKIVEPSLLSETELMRIFEMLNKHFIIAKDAEITLEANPDDLAKEKIKQLKATPI